MLKEREIIQFMEEDTSSDKKRFARVGQRYYEGEHDIRNYRLYYYNADGQLVEDKTRSNIKISHPFFTELVDQEVQYMLSGKDGFVKSNIPELQNELDSYFNENEDFTSELYEILTGAITKGFEYMYAYKNSEDRIAKDNKKIKRIQVWDKDQTYFYVQEEEGKLELDGSVEINPRPHTLYKKGNSDDWYYEGFGFIPFFRLDNCQKQFSGLKSIKELIDDYDLMSCGLSNNLQDAQEYLVVVSGFQGDNMEELIQNTKTKKHIGVDENGGVEFKTVDVPYDARKTKLELDEKNIYRFGMGFNSAQLGDGNITNIVIKSRYALLDLKCNKLEIRLRQFLRKILKVILAEINQINETDYQQKDVYFEFEREVMTNASDNASIEKTDAETEQVKINTLLNLASTLDQETIVQNICDILDINYEDIKSKLPNDDDNLNAQSELEEVVVEDE